MEERLEGRVWALGWEGETSAKAMEASERRSRAGEVKGENLEQMRQGRRGRDLRGIGFCFEKYNGHKASINTRGTTACSKPRCTDPRKYVRAMIGSLERLGYYSDITRW